MCVGGVSVCGREAERGCVFVGLCCGHLLNDGTTGSALKTTRFVRLIVIVSAVLTGDFIKMSLLTNVSPLNPFLKMQPDKKKTDFIQIL